MQDYVWWWIIAGALGVAELMTGTFFLLVLSVAAVAASGAAKLGLGLAVQMLVAAVVAVAGWSWLRARKKPAKDEVPELDIGEVIEVRQWKGALGSTQYRGANWTVELDPGSVPDGVASPGKFRIQALRGNRLIVRPADPL